MSPTNHQIQLHSDGLDTKKKGGKCIEALKLLRKDLFMLPLHCRHILLHHCESLSRYW